MFYFNLAIFIILLSFGIAGYSATPWVPTRKHDYSRIFSLAEIRPDEVFMELGCGGGLLLTQMAKQGAKTIGYEISLLPFFVSLLRKIFQNQKTSLHFKSLWRADLRSADIVYFFLMPNIMPKLKEKILRECRPRTKIISYAFPIADLPITKTDEQKGHPPIYLYKI
ncbi:MAG: hypothetical protein WCT18_05025 [Patescibacteria group bacterium]